MIKNQLTKAVIRPNHEPGVIDNEMLTRCVLEKGPTGEAGILFAEEGVHLEEVTILILEFQNIIRIDHLFVLKFLTRLTLSNNCIERIENLHELAGLVELDLSFNKIKKIENLEALVNIEVLSLFHNSIRKIENFDHLQKLLIFSIGDNCIEDYKEVTYLRRFRFLRSISFKGNPCCYDDITYKFLKSALWRLTYLDYKKITTLEREEGRKFFRALLQQLDDEDEKREKERTQREQYQAEVEFYALSFVEYLRGPEHFESMFQQDPNGALALQAGGEILEFYEQYKEQYVDTMSELVEFAQEQYSVREAEVKAFQEVVSAALDASVARSKEIMADYKECKQPLYNQLKNLIEHFIDKTTPLDELEPKLLVLGENFNELLNNVWNNLMKEELSLYEECEGSVIFLPGEVGRKTIICSAFLLGEDVDPSSPKKTPSEELVFLAKMLVGCVAIRTILSGTVRREETNRCETRVQFSMNLTKLVNKLLEVCRNAFGLWREHECVWSMRAGEALSKLMCSKTLTGASKQLIEMLTERDSTMKAVAASTDSHSRFIDSREDRLISRATEWKDILVSNTNNNEIKRNRDRILEINYFLDNQRTEWEELRMDLTESPADAENAVVMLADGIRFVL